MAIFRRPLLGAVALSLCLSAPLPAAAITCVQYARAASGIGIHGDAWTWWRKARGLYKRGHLPDSGAVLAFTPSGQMRLGHVAVVAQVLGDRMILINHANWAIARRLKGKVKENVLVIDVSKRNNWSAVRVWNQAAGAFGRVYPTHGFIYPENLAAGQPAPAREKNVQLAER